MSKLTIKVKIQNIKCQKIGRNFVKTEASYLEIFTCSNLYSVYEFSFLRNKLTICNVPFHYFEVLEELFLQNKLPKTDQK